MSGIKAIDVNETTLEGLKENTVNVQAINNGTAIAGVEEGLVEKIEDISKLTKDELIGLVKRLQEDNKHMSETISHHADEKDEIVKDINKYYQDILTQKNRIINYQRKKLNLIVDLIKMEEDK